MENLTYKVMLKRTQIEANQAYDDEKEEKAEAKRLASGKKEGEESEEVGEESEGRPVITLDDIVQDYLTSDQSFVFSDAITIYQKKIIDATLVIVDQKVYFLF